MNYKDIIYSIRKALEEKHPDWDNIEKMVISKPEAMSREYDKGSFTKTITVKVK